VGLFPRDFLSCASLCVFLGFGWGVDITDGWVGVSLYVTYFQ
jgi:hypothetical protein